MPARQTHDADGFRERGFSGSLSWDPTPETARGLSVSLSQTVGTQASGGMEALLQRDTLAGLAANDDAKPVLEIGARVTARFGCRQWWQRTIMARQKRGFVRFQIPSWADGSKAGRSRIGVLATTPREVAVEACPGVRPVPDTGPAASVGGAERTDGIRAVPRRLGVGQGAPPCQACVADRDGSHSV